MKSTRSFYSVYLNEEVIGAYNVIIPAASIAARTAVKPSGAYRSLYGTGIP